ncbi:hypothetical protein [Nannocystis pusilla]|uniref:hypothetical protein n=1 Tax=Nannocystis pusilla TaxID=889268 RepID=UPI003B7E6611
MTEIRLALREGTNYRVTTIGNIRFGSLVQPTGFAREERLSLKDCEGEGYSARARSSTATSTSRPSRRTASSSRTTRRSSNNW